MKGSYSIQYRLDYLLQLNVNKQTTWVNSIKALGSESWAIYIVLSQGFLWQTSVFSLHTHRQQQSSSTESMNLHYKNTLRIIMFAPVSVCLAAINQWSGWQGFHAIAKKRNNGNALQATSPIHQSTEPFPRPDEGRMDGTEKTRHAMIHTVSVNSKITMKTLTEWYWESGIHSYSDDKR